MWYFLFYEVIIIALNNKYFGTDGFRGEANVQLTSEHAYKIGRFLGWYYSSQIFSDNEIKPKPRIVIGKDTRLSSYMLEYSLVAGITASGADAYMLHVTTTPSVPYVVLQDDFDCGVMITASHNPFYDNGIKIVNRYGEKIDDNTAALIEAYIDGNTSVLGLAEKDIPLSKYNNIGKIVDYSSGRNRYIGYLISTAMNSYKNLKIGLDCANGSGWMIAKSVFNALGANTKTISSNPNGININVECGSTNPKALSELVKREHLHVGFAFDGDADRCIAVDENGRIIDGDMIMYILAMRFKRKGLLEDDTIVATTMSNRGVLNSLSEKAIKYQLTDVGDRFIYEKMNSEGFSLGGEKSGHIIMKKYATTGDGLLTAIMLTEEMCDTKMSLSALCKDINVYPQYEISLRVKDKDMVMTDSVIIDKLNTIQKKLGSSGRIIIRKSGTEPVVRIMGECIQENECNFYVDEMAKCIISRGFCSE